MIVNFIRVISVANAVSLLFGYAPWHTGATGTFDTALMAITVPLFLVESYWILALIPISLAIFAQGEGTALAVLIAQLLYLLPWMITAPVGLAAIIFTPLKVFQEIIVSHMLRLKMWATYIGYWWDRAPIAIGFGHGKFAYYASRLPVDGKSFVWAHNDWLEILFELGFIGLLFALCTFGFLLYKARHSKSLSCSLLGFGTCMFFYSPLQVVTGQLILLGLVLEITQRSNE